MAGRGVRRALAVVVLAVTASLLTACGGVTPAATITQLTARDAGAVGSGTAKKLDAALQTALAASGASGAIAGVWAPWAGSWTQADGTTTQGGSTPMTTSMSFRIGSLTKPVTCTVLLQLVKKGTLSLDDKVSKYLPRLVGLNGLTLGQLCQNTSGLGDYQQDLLYDFVTNPTRPWSDIELINNALGEPTAAKHNVSWQYSNGGFIVLGMALEAATGRSWTQLYQQYVTEPLGLAHTSVPSGDTLPSPSPHGYATAIQPNSASAQCGTTVDVSKLSPSMGDSSVGMVSTLDDTASLVHAVAAGSFVGSTLAAQQRKGVATTKAAPSWDSYGLGVENVGGLIGHASSIPGFDTAAYSDPDSGLTVVVMFNNSTSGANFPRLVALQLAAIALQATPKSGSQAPSLQLPFTADQAAAALPYSTTCIKKGVPPTANPVIIALAHLVPGN